MTPRIAGYRTLAPMDGGVLFAGDSLFDWAPFAELYPGLEFRNYGVAGDTTEDLEARLAEVIDNAPDRVFLLIGTNDLAVGRSVEDIAAGVIRIAGRLSDGMPPSDVYVLSLLPREARARPYIEAINERLDAASAQTDDFDYLAVGGALEGPDGGLDPGYTPDGLHLNAAGYRALAKALTPCVRAGC